MKAYGSRRIYDTPPQMKAARARVKKEGETETEAGLELAEEMKWMADEVEDAGPFFWREAAKVYVSILEELRSRSEDEPALRATLVEVWRAYTPSLWDSREARTFTDPPKDREHCETCGGNWHGDKAFEYGYAAGLAKGETEALEFYTRLQRAATTAVSESFGPPIEGPEVCGGEDYEPLDIPDVTVDGLGEDSDG